MRNRTRHAVSRWMSIADVARELGCSEQTARLRVKSGSIPGGELMYRYDGRKGERWHVDRETFTAWRAALSEQRLG